MEQVVKVDQAVFAGRPPDQVARTIVDGALKVGNYRAGMLVLSRPDGAHIASAVGEAFEGAVGRPAPPELLVKATSRLDSSFLGEIAQDLGITSPGQGIYLVPFATPDTQ